MRKLDRYIIHQFLIILMMALIGFLAVFIIVDLFENLDRFIDNSVPAKIVLMYYWFTIPWFLSIGFPMATLIATVFSIGLMAKRNEWTAMKSTGISLYRIAIPLLVAGIFLSIVSYQFDNGLVSWGNEKRYDIERHYLKKRARRAFTKTKRVLTDVFMQKQGNTHIALSKFKVKKKSANDVTVLILENGIVRQRVDAKNITWIDSLSLWATSKYSLRFFSVDGKETSAMIAKSDTLLDLNFTPEDITRQFKSPDELNYNELTNRIALLKENGVKTIRWEVARYFKISFAFTNLIVIMFGLPLVVLKPKGGLSFGAGMSVFVIFSYYAFIKFGQSLGYKELLDPLLSAWIGNIVFLSGGVLLLIFARK